MVESLLEFKNYIVKEDITFSVLKIISNSNCLYFNAKKIRHDLYKQYGFELRGRPSSQIDVCNDLHFKMILSCRIGHITRKLKKEGYIEKFNQRTWQKIKNIDLTDPKLYTND